MFATGQKKLKKILGNESFTTWLVMGAIVKSFRIPITWEWIKLNF